MIIEENKPIARQEVINWIEHYNQLTKRTWLFRNKIVASELKKDEFTKHPYFGYLLGWANYENIISPELTKIIAALQLPACHNNIFEYASNVVNLMKRGQIYYRDVLYKSEKTYTFDHLLDGDEFGTEASTIRFDILNINHNAVVVPSMYTYVLHNNAITSMLLTASDRQEDYTKLYDFNTDPENLIKYPLLRTFGCITDMSKHLYRPDIYNNLKSLISDIEVDIPKPLLNSMIEQASPFIQNALGISLSQFILTLGYCHIKHVIPTKEEMAIADIFEFTDLEQVYTYLQDVKLAHDVELPMFH